MNRYLSWYRKLGCRSATFLEISTPKTGLTHDCTKIDKTQNIYILPLYFIFEIFTPKRTSILNSLNIGFKFLQTKFERKMYTGL